MTSVGVGIVTYNRPDYFRQVIDAALGQFGSMAQLFVYNDGSQPNDEYERIFAELPATVTVLDVRENRGVAHAKNELLRAMQKCDYVFTLEDDAVPLSPLAITAYIETSLATGIEHLNWAHDGANKRVGADKHLEYFRDVKGAWSFYTRRSLDTVGYFDEHFQNAWEHVEHTHRLALAGFTTPFRRFADVSGSQHWFRILPGARKTSKIRTDPNWQRTSLDGLLYWSKKDPEHFPLRSWMHAQQAVAAFRSLIWR